jgi:hypothetical protein
MYDLDSPYVVILSILWVFLYILHTQFLFSFIVNYSNNKLLTIIVLTIDNGERHLVTLLQVMRKGYFNILIQADAFVLG